MEQTVRIERYADQGRCVAHIDGRVVFVRFALPGELVKVTLDEPHNRDDRFWTGEVTEVIEASDQRVEPAPPDAAQTAPSTAQTEVQTTLTRGPMFSEVR